MQYMKNNISYKLKNIYPKVSVLAKISAICGIGIGEYPRIGGNFGIGAALPKIPFPNERPCAGFVAAEEKAAMTVLMKPP